MNYRLLFSDNGTLTDYSYQLNNYYSGSASLAFVASQDKLYIGSLFPFNSMYFKMATGSGSDAGISIKYWDSSQWRSAVEVIDETSGLQSSGFVTWQVDRQNGWVGEDTVNGSGVANITELSSVTIYDMHWVQVTLATDVSFDISWIGHIFCNDNDLFTEYPDFNNANLMTAIKAAKTNFEEQEVRASQILVEDLIANGTIKHESQILDRRKLINACVSKSAEIIYGILGDDYIDQKRDAMNEYKSRIKKDLFAFDINKDGDLSEAESTFRQGYVYR
ncbi:MAG: hypothetical protein KDD61_09095 [Bdellovibrionales bacterium]|nr:hypothetical protein [Bdellovibrionales bacterium]